MQLSDSHHHTDSILAAGSSFTPSFSLQNVPGVLGTQAAGAPSAYLDSSCFPAAVRRIPRPVSAVLAHALKIRTLLGMLRALPPGLDARAFAVEALRRLDIAVAPDPELAAKLPASGPLVIVCNHPFGGIDGLALMAALLPHRPDLKIMANALLGAFAPLRDCCLPLDVLSGSSAAGRNAASLRLADKALQEGRAVAFFPAGGVSFWQRGKGIVDSPWQTTAARFALRHKAPVLPLYFEGRNSLLFSMAGLVHPLLRTLMLPKEMLRRKGGTVRLLAGRPVEAETLRLLGSPEAATEYLRQRSYSLGATLRRVPAATQARGMEPVAASQEPAALRRIIDALPADSLLLREGEYAVYCLRGEQSPVLLDEVGVLREHTFRLVGEGSGKARDVDAYDRDYYHLLLWHESQGRLAGAYRLGKAQELLAAHGPGGLYTSTLFRMGRRFFKEYGTALELGRAVVHPDFQREYAPLLLLWKGIGAFVLRNPEVRCLFGPVSMGLDYSPASLRAVIDYLSGQYGSPALALQVRGRHAPEELLRRGSPIPLPGTLPYNGLVSLVRDMEGGRGVPILFKHYLKLGGRIAAFHMDVTFNSLDAFLLIDLAKAPKGMLERYMTPDGAAAFLERWQKGAQ